MIHETDAAYPNCTARMARIIDADLKLCFSASNKNGDAGVSDADPLPTPYPAGKTPEIASPPGFKPL